MNNHYLLAIFVSIFIFSCCSKKDKDKDVEAGLTITVDFSKKEDVSKSFFADSVKYIKLETNNDILISGIKKIRMGNDGRLYILDELSKIFVFSNKGDFIYSINSIGEGPGEYGKIDNFNLNEQKGLIEILDLALRKVLQFNINDGTHINSVPLSKLVFNIFSTDNNNYLASLPCNLDDIRFGVFLLDENYMETDSLIFFSGSYPLFSHDIGVFSKLDQGKYGIYSQVENAVYHYSQSKLEKKYVFDFKNKIKIEDSKGKTLETVSKDEIGDYDNIFFYKETNSMIILYASSEDNAASMVLYDKIEDKLKVLGRIVEKEDPIVTFIKSETKNVLFCQIPVGALLKASQENAENTNLLNKDILDLLEKSSFEDNPIIQIIYLKH